MLVPMMNEGRPWLGFDADGTDERRFARLGCWSSWTASRLRGSRIGASRGLRSAPAASRAALGFPTP
jgi:hypothetical protein